MLAEKGVVVPWRVDDLYCASGSERPQLLDLPLPRWQNGYFLSIFQYFSQEMTWELVSGANTAAFSHLMTIPVFTTQENINRVGEQAEPGRLSTWSDLSCLPPRRDWMYSPGSVPGSSGQRLNEGGQQGNNVIMKRLGKKNKPNQKPFHATICQRCKKIKKKAIFLTSRAYATQVSQAF